MSVDAADHQRMVVNERDASDPVVALTSWVEWWQRIPGSEQHPLTWSTDRSYIVDVNPGGHDQNCASCALAVDARAGGGPALIGDADDVSPRAAEYLETIVDCPCTAIATPGVPTSTLLLRMLAQLPPGHRALVLVGYTDDSAGHIINAVNEGDNFWIYDGQTGAFTNDPLDYAQRHQHVTGGVAMIPTTDWRTWPLDNPLRQCIEQTVMRAQNEVSTIDSVSDAAGSALG